MRGIRGATTIDRDHPTEVIKLTRELLCAIQTANGNFSPDEIASIIFTVTNDIKSTFPARAARELGWDFVPLMCALEIPVPGSLQRCIRVLIHWNTDKQQDEIQHIYLRGAQKLRPDIINRHGTENKEMKA
ncbi:MAG: chorismate mutase [Brevefilum sp.]